MNLCLRAKKAAARRLERFLSLKSGFCLFSQKKRQKRNFFTFQSRFFQMFNKIRMQQYMEFLTPFWKDYNEKLERVFLPQPPFDFLRNKIIRGTMFVDAGGRWMDREIRFLEKMLPSKILKELLQEDYVGRPIIRNSKYLTSHNSIHHLYHLINFQEKTGVKIDQCRSLIEWGGGYGNMAKIVKKMNMGLTYTIIDIPLFSCLQWLYLASIFGEGEVNIMEDSKCDLKQGKINIVPVGLIKEKSIKGDIFIATWSLSESSKFAQDYVDWADYFGAEHFLIAFQESNERLPDAFRIRDITAKRGAKVEAIEFLPGNYYGFL